MDVRSVIALMISTGVLDVKTGAVNLSKLQGHWSIEDGGRRGVKITRTAKGARDVGGDGAEGGGCKGGKG